MNKMISKIFSFIFVVNFLSASQVTLHVDMNGQTVSANGVHVAGNFGDYDYDNTFENPAYPNWDPAGIALTDDDSDGVYSVTLDLVPGTIEYKFINGNAGAEKMMTNGLARIMITSHVDLAVVIEQLP